MTGWWLLAEETRLLGGLGEVLKMAEGRGKTGPAVRQAAGIS